MQPSDITYLTSLGAPTISPDASFTIFASSRPDLDANRAVGQLWRLELPRPATGGGARARARHAAAADALAEPRRLTRGVADSAPQLSPDGTVLAFLRADDSGTAQIHLLDPRGGEPQRVTNAPLGVGRFVFSPDGARIAYLARVPEPGRYGTARGLGPDAESPRRITGLRWHANGVGYTLDRPTHVFVLEIDPIEGEPHYTKAPTPDASADEAGKTDEAAGDRALPHTPVQLTDGPLEHSAIAFTADGSAVLAVRGQDLAVRDARHHLLRLPVPAPGAPTDGIPEPQVWLAPEDGFAIGDVATLPDGTTALLAAQPVDGTDTVAPDTALWLLEQDGPRRVTDPETVDVGSATAAIVAVGEDVLVQHLTRGRVHVLRIGRDGGIEVVIGGDVEVGGLAAAGSTVVASAALPASAGEILHATLPVGASDDEGSDEAAPQDGRDVRVLTDFGAPLREHGIAAPRELEIIGRDGYPVHGWLAVPEGEGPYPVILMIHGGPYAHYGLHVFDEVQTLVDAGCAVAFCNPRGSAGYGRAHGRAIRHRMGTLDAADVLDFFDGAIAADAEDHPGRLDTERLGIMGGSYGGYLTAWTIAHDHRFRAAIVERGYLDPATFRGTSDIGSFFTDEYIGSTDEDVQRQSPYAHVEAVRTPTLVVHSEQDYRCPLEQGTRYYTALKRQGVETEMLVFPGENHELTRSGSPRHRIERFEAVLDWWERAFTAVE